MSRTGILGGTFDPLHNGHIAVALHVKNKLHLDKVLLVPASIPPQKKNQIITDYSIRYELISLSIRKIDGLEVCNADNTSGTSYSLNLVRKLSKLYPEDEFFFIVGEDSLAELTTWHRWQELITECGFVVVNRSDSMCPAPDLAPFAHRISYVNMPPVDISSSEIRFMILNHEDIAPYVPKSVASFYST
ncbi:MAG: nicotinate-nucleotide adenylyltransferase [Candidatus Cloacimonetes bacterium]|nr:nicotinate-nucleotide adenylyltransferase [Candidatus Cloacimonadota bacterium]